VRVSEQKPPEKRRVVESRRGMPKGTDGAGGRRTWLLSLGVGLVLAVGVRLRARLHDNDTIKDAGDVTRPLKLPFLGSCRRSAATSLRCSPRARAATISASRSGREDVALSEIHGRRHQDRGWFTSAQPLEGKKRRRRRRFAMARPYGGSRVC